MRLSISIPVALIAAATLCAAGCGSDNSRKATSPTPRASETGPVGGTATGVAGATATEPAAAVTPGAPTTATPEATAPAPPPGTRLERAPIDVADVVVRESSPPQYAVSIHSGLPSGCQTYDHTDVSRSGTRITIDVWNSVPSGTGIACTAIYGTHEQVVELGSDLTPGVTYEIVVNDRTLSVRGQ